MAMEAEVEAEAGMFRPTRETRMGSRGDGTVQTPKGCTTSFRQCRDQRIQATHTSTNNSIRLSRMGTVRHPGRKLLGGER